MGKTVTTYLIDGDPQGTQYAFISNKICQMFVVPRSNLSYLKRQEKLQKPAFYILVGESDEGKPKAYIGETENFRERVKDHDNKKLFWQKALIFVSKDEDMTKSDVQYLEHRAVEKAMQAKTYQLDENKQTPKCPNLPEYQRDTMNEFFEDISFLAAFSGCNIFEQIEIKQEEQLFFLKGKNCDAKGIYHSSGFTVLKGSIVSKTMRDSYQSKEQRLKTLSELALLSESAESYTLHSDLTFSSPSGAAAFCLGRSSNGWTSWLNGEGRSLDEEFRREME